MTGVHWSKPFQLPHGEWVISCVLCKRIGTGAPVKTREEAVELARSHEALWDDRPERLETGFADRFADPY